MNRADRRALARMQGHKPDAIRAAKRAERVTQKLEAKVLKMGAPAARKLLAEWAARGGDPGADLDLLNKVANHGIREIKDSFNLVANPDATASKALLGYKTQGLTQYQVLTFSGAWADGAVFEIKSDLIRPNADPVLMARTTATQLLATKGIER